MTLETVGRSRPGVTKAWIIPFGILSGLAMAALGGVLSRSVFLDLIAWWPVWLALFLLARFARNKNIGVVRLSGLVAVLGLVMVFLFSLGHLGGWGLMPSAAGRLIGPEVGDTQRAVLSASIDGTLNVATTAEFLYEVIPIRRGGPVGVPDATEDTVETTVIVSLDNPDSPGLQTFAGWNLRISDEPVWELALAGAITADLSSIELTGLRLAGGGEVVLGMASGVTDVNIRGSFNIEVPSTAVVRVIGVAEVPAGWEQVEDGWQSPLTGDGWVITVEPGATLVISTPN